LESVEIGGGFGQQQVREKTRPNNPRPYSQIEQ
jgi:hypothetical protein